MVWYDVTVICELLVADRAFPALLSNLAVEQFAHLRRRPELPVSPGVVSIFDALNAKLKSAFFPHMFPAAAEQRMVNWAIFIATEFHGSAPVWGSC